MFWVQSSTDDYIRAFFKIYLFVNIIRDLYISTCIRVKVVVHLIMHQHKRQNMSLGHSVLQHSQNCIRGRKSLTSWATVAVMGGQKKVSFSLSLARPENRESGEGRRQRTSTTTDIQTIERFRALRKQQGQECPQRRFSCIQSHCPRQHAAGPPQGAHELHQGTAQTCLWPCT